MIVIHNHSSDSTEVHTYINVRLQCVLKLTVGRRHQCVCVCDMYSICRLT